MVDFGLALSSSQRRTKVESDKKNLGHGRRGLFVGVDKIMTSFKAKRSVASVGRRVGRPATS